VNQSQSSKKEKQKERTRRKVRLKMNSIEPKKQSIHQIMMKIKVQKNQSSTMNKAEKTINEDDRKRKHSREKRLEAVEDRNYLSP